MAKLHSSSAYGEPTPKSYFEDMAWIRANRRHLVEQYGDCYIVVYAGKVLGVGQTRLEAFSNSEANLPEELSDIVPAYDYITLKSVFTGFLRRKQS